jgi:hypothetical protein
MGLCLYHNTPDAFIFMGKTPKTELSKTKGSVVFVFDSCQ